MPGGKAAPRGLVPNGGDGSGSISPPSGLHAPQAAAWTNPAAPSRDRGGPSTEDSGGWAAAAPALLPLRPAVPAWSAAAGSGGCGAPGGGAREEGEARGRAGGWWPGPGARGSAPPIGPRSASTTCGAAAQRRAPTPPPLLPPRARANKTSCRSQPPEGAGGSLTLILLSGLGSSGRGDREDQRTTSPRKLPTTSKLRKMNPIFSLIFLRRRETQSPAQPPPQLSPPSFPLLRLSTSSLPHPYRLGCRPLRRLPFRAPDPELPLALPSPGLFPPPPLPAAGRLGLRSAAAPPHPPPPTVGLRRAPTDPCASLFQASSLVSLPSSQPAALFFPHYVQESSWQFPVTL